MAGTARGRLAEIDPIPPKPEIFRLNRAVVFVCVMMMMAGGWEPNNKKKQDEIASVS